MEIDKPIEKSKVIYFRKKILNWYRKEGRKYSWRNGNYNEHQIIISEILLQRTKAEVISKFIEIFFNEFPEWSSIVNAGENSIKQFLTPIGLQQHRAKRIFTLAMAMKNHDYKLPANYNELTKITSFGQYLKNSIELQIYYLPRPLLDINMVRILKRFFEVKSISDYRNDFHIQNLSHAIVQMKYPLELNWGILDYASLICKKKPLCSKCLLKKKCPSYTNNSRQKF